MVVLRNDPLVRESMKYNKLTGRIDIVKKGFQPTGMFTALGFVIIYVIIFCFCALAPKFGMNGKKWKSLIGRFFM